MNLTGTGHAASADLIEGQAGSCLRSYIFRMTNRSLPQVGADAKGSSMWLFESLDTWSGDLIH